MSLRFKLLLIALSTLALPLAGWLFVRHLFARAWQHEFNEGFMRDGVSIFDPHVTTAVA